MTVVESPKGRASHNLGNRGAIPPFPPPGYCYIFFQNLSRKESSSPPAPSRFRLILRLEKTAVPLVELSIDAVRPVVPRQEFRFAAKAISQDDSSRNVPACKSVNRPFAFKILASNPSPTRIQRYVPAAPRGLPAPDQKGGTS